VKYRVLGETGIRVSEVGFGAWAIGGPVDLFGIPVGWGKVDDRESEAAIQRALDLGVNFFDTADVYGSGHSEELIGHCLEGKECVIATKGGNARTEKGAIKDFSTPHIRAAIEGSLRRLKRDSIDVYQLHNPSPGIWQADEVFSLLEQVKKEGKIRARGVSISAIDEGIHLIKTGKVDCLQVLLNILNQEPAKELLPLAEEYGIGIIVRVPIAAGLLTGKFNKDHQFPGDDNRKNYLTRKRFEEVIGKVAHLKELTDHTGYTLAQVALNFLLKFSAVSTIIPGAKTPAQVEQNVSASDATLSEEVFRSIRNEFQDYNFFLRYHVRV